MRTTIWHNPRCSKSRDTLAILIDSGAAVSIVDYLEHPPTRDQLARVCARGGIAPRNAMRKDAPTLVDDAAALDAMAADAALIERPLVETAKGVRLCRPPERVRDIL